MYHYYRLVHAYRIGNKTRQQSILNLGTLEQIDVSQHKALADRIEEIITGTSSLFPVELNNEVENLAQKFARQIKDKKIFPFSKTSSAFEDKSPKQQYIDVDLSTIDKEDDREMGGSWLCKQAFDTLQFEEILKNIGLSDKQTSQALCVLTAKMVHPSSDLESQRWMDENSALSELYGPTGVPSRYQIYKVSDLLYKNKTVIGYSGAN